VSHLLLPVGISFYTLQALGYTIDVFRNELPPERNFGRYALFVSFFPQLVAGPIERAGHLLPQFRTVHSFNNEQCLEGVKMMVWGYFMKLCIADRVSSYVEAVFNYSAMHNGTSLMLGTFFFSFQIYCDFAGYSLIALGVAKCLGFELMTNFNRPYLARDIQDFWRHWHISLSQWLRDYVYFPLGGSRCSLPRHLSNLLITFLVSGVWHGAKWTFVLWGALHGIFVILNILKNKYLPSKKNKSTLRIISSICLTFMLVMFLRIFSRSNDIPTAFAIFKTIFTNQGPLFKGEGIPEILLAVACIGLLMLKEIKDEMELNIRFIHNKNSVISTVSLALMICFILLTAVFTGKAFIYFQF
jgi:D-alanyl-lipoteichoic acid acyltransferase DltB (MBOAT superfamily)